MTPPSGRLRTRLTERLAITYPVVQAPIGSASSAELAAAVSEAGGLGSLSITWRADDEIRRILRHVADRTARPIAANVVLVWPPEVKIALALEAGISAVWTFWGDPAPYVDAIHRGGALAIHTAGSRREAEAAAAAGVDVLVLQGVESGGHVRGVVGSRELLADVRRGLPDVPIAVAGGIADGADLARALADGADGAVLGTRFLCTPEADAADVYRRAVLDAREGDTLLTGLFDKGWPSAPHRVLRNSTVRAWEAAGRPEPGGRPGEHDCIAVDARGTGIERYSDTIPTRRVSGELEALALYAGESSARIFDVLPAAEIVERLVREADAALAD